METKVYNVCLIVNRQELILLLKGLEQLDENLAEQKDVSIMREQINNRLIDFEEEYDPAEDDD